MTGIIISMKDEMKIKAFKALGDPTRLHILKFLSANCCGRAAVRDTGEVESPTAGEVCCHVTGLEKINSTISHHLHELESAGLITMERRGKASLCTLDQNAILALASSLTELAGGTDTITCDSDSQGCC